MKRIFSLILSLSIVSVACAFNKHVIDSLEAEMSKAATLEDSTVISLHLMDAANTVNMDRRSKLALSLARRTGNVEEQLEILRRLAHIHAHNDTLIQSYIDAVTDLPSNPSKSTSILYMSILKNRAAAVSSSNEYCREEVQKLMRQAEASNGSNLHTRIKVLFTLCAYLEQVSSSDLLSEYLDSVGVLIQKMPRQLDDLNMLYLDQVASSNTAMGKRQKGVDADRELLAYIDSVKARQIARGRPFRDYDYLKYTIFRRLLGNYEVMTPDDVHLLYHKAREYAWYDPKALADFMNARRPDIYFFMSQQRYEDVKPLIRRELAQTDHELLPYVRRLLLHILYTAGEKTNDKDAMFDALMGLRNIENSDVLRQRSEQLKELQMIYENNMAKLAKASIEASRHATERNFYMYGVIIGSILIIILLCLVIMQIRSQRRAKKLVRQLAGANAKLTEESDSLRRTQADLIRVGERVKAADRQKEEFINNMSHEVSTPLNAIVEYSQLIVDCADEGKRPYLTRFSNVIKQSADMLIMLFNDVLDLASSDKKTLKIERRPTVMGSIAAIAVDAVRGSIKPDVKLINNITPDYNELINTDGKRVTQVLLNLLSNAAKFTDSGSVTIDGALEDSGLCYKFTVTDTGIGIPKGREEVIFDRFEKLNRFSPGIGLGLSVSRMVAGHLGGTVRVDTDYKGPGARFVFTISAK